MKYPIGTKLKLKSIPPAPYGMSAKIGATAIVTKDFDSDRDDYVYVEWERNNLSGSQSDGGYFANNFVQEELSTCLAQLEYMKKVIAITVGSEVITPLNNHGTVIFIDNDLAWVRTRRGQNTVIEVSKLKKVL
jgi:hypothetical protein